MTPARAAQPLPLHDALQIPTPASGRPALIATVGGGGKTTLLFALAAERASAGQAGASPRLAVLTTTTRFTIPPQAASLPLVLAADPLARAAEISVTTAPTVIVGSRRGERGRVRGVEPEWPAQALGLDHVDFVAVEADGSAGRPFKAPADHEPVIPHDASHIIAVVGVQALAKPLDARSVHRPQRVRALVGETAIVTAHVTANVIAHVLAHPNGGRKNVPPDAQFAVAITHAMRDRDGAAAIALACHAAGIDRVIEYDAQADLVRTI
jgi:molybdenum cofactor cytidylyltransferase